MFKRNLLPALIIALVIICSCDSKVNNDPAAWPVDPIEVFILISNEFGDNLLEDATDGNWYTIDGRRLTGQPTKKGVYIQHGKKVIPQIRY